MRAPGRFPAILQAKPLLFFPLSFPAHKVSSEEGI